MKSPFPGMDPYLEPHWPDVHTKVVTYAADELNTRLPQDLIASTEERVAVESGVDGTRWVGPGARVFEPPVVVGTVVAPETGAAVAAPWRLLAQSEPITERFIRVIEAGTERLVTVIEFVSPTNKSGEGLHAFRAKRAELLESGVNFVEIDLVRVGTWRALLRPHVCPAAAFSPYRVTIRVPPDPAAVYLYPIRLREALPEVRVPLRRDDPPVPLGLQGLIEQAYANGRYARRVNYARPPEPPLAEEDAAWVEQRLRDAGGLS